jgi:hypothetical protein
MLKLKRQLEALDDVQRLKELHLLPEAQIG